MKTEDQYHIDTRLIHGKRESTNWDYSHHLVPPVSASATFKLDSVERGAQIPALEAPAVEERHGFLGGEGGAKPERGEGK